MTESVTRTLAAFAAGLEYADLPDDVVTRTRQLLLDITGISVRALHDTESTAPMQRALERLGLAAGESIVIGDTRGYSPTAAALLNGATAHSLDFDDTHAAGSLHSSAPIVPAALAAAQMTNANGADLVAAIVAGYEVQIRLSLALNPREHYEAGFHPTATCGTFGAAAAAGRLLGLDEDGMASAFGICGSQAAGSMQFLADGAWNKRFHVGHAAANGLMAASLAMDGYQGAEEALEGRAGFLASYAPNAKPELAIDGLGERWETLSLAVKPYPSCRYSHAAMDGLVALREEHSLAPEDIESVEIGLSATGYRIIGDPIDTKHRPESVVDGQFSMPFCAAVALREGGMGWDDYDKHLGDAETLALTRRVTTCVDERAEAEFPAQMSAVVRVRTADGEYERFVRIPKGEPENFVTDEELRAKFDGLVAPYLPTDTASALADGLLAIEQQNNVASLFELSRGGSAA